MLQTDLWTCAAPSATTPHGTFDARARGVRDPGFLRSLPKTAENFVRAVKSAGEDAYRSRRAAAELRAGNGSTASVGHA